MRFMYKFTSLLGTVYHKGNLLFTPDGQTLISPVGNRVTFYNLRSNESWTMQIDSRYNLTTLALSPNGHSMVAVNEAGQALFCSLICQSVFHRFHFRRPVQDIKYSPNGKYIAVTKESKVFLYHAPESSIVRCNPFRLERVFHCSYDETMCMDWTSDSRILAVSGKDMTTKIYAVEKMKNFSICTLGSHKDTVIGCYFEDNSLDMYTVSKDGVLCVWDCSIDLDSLIPEEMETESSSEEEEDFVDCSTKGKKIEKKVPEEKTYYRRVSRHFTKDAVKKEGDGYLSLTASAYHRQTHLFVAGFSNGAFLLYEMPDCNLIHSLSISSQGIQSIAFNSPGDWIALGCSGIGQLVVWEWQSESFVLKQQGHFNNMHCVCFSPEGMYIATGGEDGKVKVWDTTTGFCFCTFSEHGTTVTGITFTQNGKAVVSASLDGTVRAYDLKRYRNFRTFVTPQSNTQLSCLAVDRSGEIVCAGCQVSFEIFVWGMPTGRLLVKLSGHEAPVSGISFSPMEAVLVSTSWDKTVRVWDVYDGKGSRETITLNASGLAIAFKPDGSEYAVATSDGQIVFYSKRTSEQLGSIEGQKDLYVGRRETDAISAKKLVKSQAFHTLCYSADGEYVLAAGVSKYICIYYAAYCQLLTRFEVTCNLSFNAVEDFINRRRLTEFGNKDLIEERRDEEIDSIATPGTKKLDKSSRTFKPQVKVSAVQFSPTGRAWVATTTEGLLLYSFDHDGFDPFDMDLDITPETISRTLHEKNYLKALIMSLHLNLRKVIIEVMEFIPVEYVENLVRQLPVLYVEKLLQFISYQLGKTQLTELYLIWINHLSTLNGIKLKQKSLSVKTILTTLQMRILKPDEFSKVGNQCQHEIGYAMTLGNLYSREAEDSVLMGVEEESLTLENLHCREAEDSALIGIEEKYLLSEDEASVIAES